MKKEAEGYDSVATRRVSRKGEPPIRSFFARVFYRLMKNIFRPENVERVKGETKWSFWKLFLYSLDGIAAFSTVPLMLASVVGLFFCFFAFMMILFIIVRKLIFGDPVSGWASLVCIILMTSGVQYFCVGILGQYLAKAYMEVKGRPIYIAREKL